jgi:hypothetical protein
MIEKNDWKIKIIMFTLLLDTFIREVLVLGDKVIMDKFYFSRIVGLLMFFSILFVTVIFDVKPYPHIFKHILIVFLFVKLFSRVIEFIYYYSIQDYRFRA